jgi:hypothetical protein
MNMPATEPSTNHSDKAAAVLAQGGPAPGLRPQVESSAPVLLAKRTTTPASRPSAEPHEVEFPSSALVGSLGDLAKVLGAGKEMPEAFIFAAGLTVIGAMTSGRLFAAKSGLESDTRLYTALVGASGDAKKSSAVRETIRFFEALCNNHLPLISMGVGSAEGLAQLLEKNRNILLFYDELRSFIDKSRAQGSVLLPMITSLYEQHDWDNATKRKSIEIRGANLSLIGCCTTETYEHMWSSEAVAIGLPNRLFIVTAPSKPRVAWPQPPDPIALDKIRIRMTQQLLQADRKLAITSDGLAAWESWYGSLPQSPHAKRLDTIGRRLMLILALTTDKEQIDRETVATVCQILNYELAVRQQTDPIDAEGTIARLEEKIRRALRLARQRMTQNELRRKTNADRSGLWAFKAAMANLVGSGDLKTQGNLCWIAE